MLVLQVIRDETFIGIQF